jgi:hypothetical protein
MYHYETIDFYNPGQSLNLVLRLRMTRFVTIVPEKGEPNVLSPGVKPGQSYEVLDTGPDWFRIRVNRRPVYVPEFLTRSKRDKRFSESDST